MTTSQLAAVLGIRAESIHRRTCVHGSYFGVRPETLLNGRLLWPDDSVEQLKKYRTTKPKAEAVHAPA